MGRMGNGKDGKWEEWEMGRIGNGGDGKNGKWDEW